MSRNLNIWGVFWTNQIQMGQNAVGRWRAEGGLQVLMVNANIYNARDLQLECARVLH